MIAEIEIKRLRAALQFVAYWAYDRGMTWEPALDIYGGRSLALDCLTEVGSRRGDIVPTADAQFRWAKEGPYPNAEFDTLKSEA